MKSPFHCGALDHRHGGDQRFPGFVHRIFDLYRGIDFLKDCFDFGAVYPVPFTTHETLPVPFQCRFMVSQLEFLLNIFSQQLFIVM